ncbi:myeloid-associated differentiation marker-like [Genypterus blacodes]|uniref:myeloid-associated differentiation marker-like n=1 Tax=Genypterus blacodes TaxID=154954 RepID=UPI003F76B224
MITVNVRSLTQPVGIVRAVATVLTCVSFSLAATVVTSGSSYWAWCMFTWFFCFFFSLLILILEFSTLSEKVPFSWDDFTAAFAILAALMCLTVSIIYPTFFTCNTCHLQIAATVVSWLSFAAYAGEVVLTRRRPERTENSGFLSTVPGLMKMLESFLACLIFTSLEPHQYSKSSALQWCVAVYSLCFIFTILIIVVSTGRLASFFPVPFDKLVTIYNTVAAVMYMTAMVIWPLYSLWKSKRPSDCGHHCPWDKLVVVSFMTILNFIVYTIDTVYSILLVFCMKDQ